MEGNTHQQAGECYLFSNSYNFKVALAVMAFILDLTTKTIEYSPWGVYPSFFANPAEILFAASQFGSKLFCRLWIIICAAATVAKPFPR